jgi:hypothetical protein
MPHQRRVSRSEQLVIEEIERLTRLLSSGSTPEGRQTAAMLLGHSKADLERLRRDAMPGRGASRVAISPAGMGRR